MHRIALAIARGPGAGARKVRDPSAKEAPRSYVFEEAFSPVWDEADLSSPARPIDRFKWWAMSRSIQARHAEYDAVVTWGEKLSIALLLHQHLNGAKKPHIAMMYQFEKANLRVPLAILKKSLHAVVTWSSVQRRALIERIGFPSQRVYLIRHYVDQVFYSPHEASDDMICAVGAEMRDYVTLKEALRGAGVRCHIATDHVRIPGPIRLLKDRRVPLEEIGGPHEANVTGGRLSLLELRDLYARSRFVVVPLRHSDTDNGVTVILEAMAMGKPVICSRTRGQVDVIQEGITGLYVPVGDPAALKAAVLSLWHEPARAREMGRNARAYVERYHSLEQFTRSARSAADASLNEQPAADTWWEQ